MAAERSLHVKVKAWLWQALDQAVRDAGLNCEAFTDGMTIRIDDRTAYEPDALVNCGAPVPADAMSATQPVIVCEVLSPSSGGRDAGAKLADYFRVPSIHHYLILETDIPRIIHHRRRDGGTIETHVLTEGTLVLDPPGIGVAVTDVYRSPTQPD